ncbi:MAG: hypothetical protein V1738_00850 [Patescibacteria group bacterium]
MHSISSHYQSNSDSRGVIVLVTVIIIGAILLVLGLSAAHIGQTEITIAGQLDRAQHARTLAMSCAEEALFRLKLDDTYLGGTIAIDDDSCTVAVTGSGDVRTIDASASSQDLTKHLQISASRRQNVTAEAQAWNIDSWLEVSP